VSKDLLNVVEELLKSPDFIEANIEFNKVNDTVKAYINLNGYFELSFFLLEVFKEINHTRLQDYLFKVIEKNDYKKFSKYYYSPVIADDDIFQTLLDATQEQDIYLLTNLEILAYKDFTFFPQHKQNTNLYDFLTKNNYLYKELAEKFLKDVQIMIRFGNASLDDIYIKLNEYDIEFRSEGDAEEFFELYFTLLNNTRMWVLRGHTPIETSGFNIQTGKFES
jgi:hypothetical protein